ncbi:hypothetical protein EYF80_059124 [Liparis tanakae]|uniref:Uncharacterized protein n=1 Tax=Liparis tanakae TaxID=230148 RepID=A0A4Z2EPL3_9TELE|nr:hypothetical protein EYF80_059124 [Liparis tanakae]
MSLSGPRSGSHEPLLGPGPGLMSLSGARSGSYERAASRRLRESRLTDAVEICSGVIRTMDSTMDSIMISTIISTMDSATHKGDVCYSM